MWNYSNNIGILSPWHRKFWNCCANRVLFNTDGKKGKGEEKCIRFLGSDPSKSEMKTKGDGGVRRTFSIHP